MEIRLFGAERCHKTKWYMAYFENQKLSYTFFDVEENKDHATTLRGLYKNGKLNFPTITIGEKKLRNPTEKELIKWLDKLSSKEDLK